MPVLLIVMLGLVQVGVAIRNELAVELAAREGARAASVSASPAAAATAAAGAVDIPVATEVAVAGSTVTVTVTYVDPTNVAIIGRFLGPTTHTASITMNLEPP